MKPPPRIICDATYREPYKGFEEPIFIRQRNGDLRNIIDTSDVVRNLRVFYVGRAYFDRNDEDAESIVIAAIEREMKK